MESNDTLGEQIQDWVDFRDLIRRDNEQGRLFSETRVTYEVGDWTITVTFLPYHDTKLMGRYGGGWKYKIGVKVGSWDSFIIDFAFGSIRVTRDAE